METQIGFIERSEALLLSFPSEIFLGLQGFFDINEIGDRRNGRTGGSCNGRNRSGCRYKVG